MESITIIGKNVGQDAQIETMKHSLENMQQRIRKEGATLDVVRLAGDITMWVDDEGLLNDSPPNLILVNGVDIVAQIHGNVFFTGVDYTEGDTIGLDDKQQNAIFKSIIKLGHMIETEAGFHHLYALYIDHLDKLFEL